jgi:hypothetical protein
VVLLNGLVCVLEFGFRFEGLTRTWEKRVEAPGRGGLQGRLICSNWVHRESANIICARRTSYCHDVEAFFWVVISLVRTCVVLIVKSSSKCGVSLALSAFEGPHSSPSPLKAALSQFQPSAIREPSPQLQLAWSLR